MRLGEFSKGSVKFTLLFDARRELQFIKGRRKRRLELTELRRFKAFIQEVAPERVVEFYTAETAHLNETAPQNHSCIEPLTSVEPAEHVNEIIEEMYETYNVHLNQFDFELFENLC